jgi:hypothetical protein
MTGVLIKRIVGQVWQFTPIIPAAQEVEAEG